MSGEVISLQEEREARQPHVSGPYQCMSCKHEFVAVTPLERLWIDCPQCGLEHARPKGNIQRVDEPHWECNCGNDLFYVTPNRTYCPMCGTTQVFG